MDRFMNSFQRMGQKLAIEKLSTSFYSYSFLIRRWKLFSHALNTKKEIHLAEQGVTWELSCLIHIIYMLLVR